MPRFARRFVCPSAHPLEPRRMLAAVSWDGGVGTSEWTDAANWSGDGLPTAADDVTIDLPAAVTVRISSGVQAINSLNCAESFIIQSGTLSVAATTNINGSFTLQNGVIAGEGNLFLNGTTATFNGGRVTGSAGTLSIGSSSTLTVAVDTTFIAKRVENHGTINMTSGDLGFEGATLINGGTIRFSGTGADFLNTAGVNSLINDGHIVRNVAGTAVIRIPLTNNGVVSVNTGSITPWLINNAAVTIAAGAVLGLPVSTLNSGSSISGAGDVAFIAGGTNTIDSSTLSITGDLRFLGGVVVVNMPLSFAEDRTITGNVTFNHPVTFGGALTIDVRGAL